MILIKRAKALQEYILDQRNDGRSLGWVPTMGALHQGHLSLVESAKQAGGLSLCSIFVNPTQFNVQSDFLHYPRTLEQDIYLLEKTGVDMLFLPDPDEVYPKGTDHLEHYDLGWLESALEGQFRPGHFQGVCQVMSRMLRIISPSDLYMGRKDYQQCMVIGRLLDIMRSKTILHTCPTLREPDGLAMSSRNLRLNPVERKNAGAIYQSLLFLQNNLKHGDTESIIGEAKEILLKNDFRIDYVVIADEKTLEPIRHFDGDQKLIALIAAFQHEIRLIDNLALNP